MEILVYDFIAQEQHSPGGASPRVVIVNNRPVSVGARPLRTDQQRLIFARQALPLNEK